MTSKVHAVTEIVGSSETSVADAIQTAVKTASASLRNLEWFEVSEIRGAIKGDAVSDFQVTLKLGFRYEK
ncbi:MAG: dodecin [Rhodospirillales bacterium]